MKRLLIAILLLMSVAAHADNLIIYQENWSSYADGQYNAGSYLGDWFVSAGSVDILGPTYHNQVCLAAGGGSKCVDLAGGNAGTLVSLDFTFDPGFIYEVTYQLAGSHKGNTNNVLVTLGDLYTQTYTMYSNDPFTTYTTGEFKVNTTTTASLTFQNLTTTYSGPLLGTVTVYDPPIAPSSVPEPMSLALIGSGLAASSITRRIRKKR